MLNACSGSGILQIQPLILTITLQVGIIFNHLTDKATRIKLSKVKQLISKETWTLLFAINPDLFFKLQSLFLILKVHGGFYV